MEQMIDNIYRVTCPYQDIYTTVYIIKTEQGTLLFDAASYPSDVDEYIAPALTECGVDTVDYIFISHNHRDHAGALSVLRERYPEATIVSRCPKLKAAYGDTPFLAPENGDRLLDVLQVVTIPGHTADAAAILDTRTGTLISGDCLQLYGIFGSGKWAANITLIPEHLQAVLDLYHLPIDRIYTAHDYHPCGHVFEGSGAITKALRSCIEPLGKIVVLINQHPEMNDEEIAALYNEADLPTLGAHVVAAVRTVDWGTLKLRR